jgi:transposase
MRAYSVDLRQRVIDDCDAGMGTTAVAEKYSVSPSWVRKLKKQRRDTGSIEPITATTGPKPALASREDRLRELIRVNPDRTASEYRVLLGAEVAVVTVWRAIRRLGFVPAGPNSIAMIGKVLFAEVLATVWKKSAGVCVSGAKLICCFGAIGSCEKDPPRLGAKVVALRSAEHARYSEHRMSLD